MSDYVSAASRARKAFAAVARLEQEAARHPDSASLQINLAARLKMARQMQEKLERVSLLEQVELCNYRIVPQDADRYFLPYVSNSLLEYQNTFSQIFDALTNGPKRRMVIGQEAWQSSLMEFAYTYSGSLGVVLLAPAERDFFSGTFDRSIEVLYDLLNISDEYEVRDIAAHLGDAVIKRVHDWSKANVQGGFDLDIRWNRSDGRQLGRVVRQQDMEKIVSIISATSDETTDKIEARGILVGGDLQARSFHFVVPNGPEYRGRLSADFPVDRTVELGRTYVANMTEFITINYATNVEVKRYELNALYESSAPDQPQFTT